MNVPTARLMWLGLGVLLGIALAVIVPWALSATTGLNRNDKWVTTRDIDLGAKWFFSDPTHESPVKGTLSAGSEFTVRWLKGGAAYIQIDHVFDRRDMATFAKPVPESVNQ